MPPTESRCSNIIISEKAFSASRYLKRISPASCKLRVEGDVLCGGETRGTGSDDSNALDDTRHDSCYFESIKNVKRQTPGH